MRNPEKEGHGDRVSKNQSNLDWKHMYMHLKMYNIAHKPEQNQQNMAQLVFHSNLD
jgi:hypothetical protein